MNIFSFTGDLLHLASIFILLIKIYSTKNCRGISLKTQVLYLTVFVCRYLDLFWNFHSMYNWLMKIIFISSSAAIVYLMTVASPYKQTYDKSADNVNVLFIVGPCAVLALLLNDYSVQNYIIEYIWCFSILLEAVAIIPQLVVVHNFAKQTNGFVENLTSHYVFTLGGYRAMYLINWIYRVFTEPGYRNWVVWLAGIVQTAIYGDFFYYYFKAQTRGERMSLPI